MLPPRGTPADFDFLHGTWSVDHEYLRERLRGCTEWERFEGTAQCDPLPGGLGNVDAIAMPSRGLTGLTVRLYDDATRTWSLHWTSTGSRVFEPPVTGAFQDGTGIFEGDDEHEGTPVRVRYVWDEITPVSARYQQVFGVAGEWELNWVMRFRRSSPDVHLAR